MGQTTKCQCRKCGEFLDIGTEWAGRKVQCPACQEPTSVDFRLRNGDGGPGAGARRGGVSEVVFYLMGGLLLAAVGACVFFLMQFRGERDAARAMIAKIAHEKAKSEKNVSDALREVERVRAENQKLKLTARHYYDRAVEAMKAADTADTNVADNAAIAGFEEVARRFPGDLLAEAARRQADGLRQRIAARDATLEKAQREVAGFVKQCRSETAMAREIRNRALRYNIDHQLDLSSVAAGNREAEPYEKAAKAARDKAREMLKRAPDPGGALAREIDDCNVP